MKYTAKMIQKLFYVLVKSQPFPIPYFSRWRRKKWKPGGFMSTLFVNKPIIISFWGCDVICSLYYSRNQVKFPKRIFPQKIVGDTAPEVWNSDVLRDTLEWMKTSEFGMTNQIISTGYMEWDSDNKHLNIYRNHPAIFVIRNLWHFM